MNATSPDQVPPRLAEVWCHIATGQPGKVIADHLGIAYSSFTTYRARLYRRIGAHSNVEATVILLKAGVSQK